MKIFRKRRLRLHLGCGATYLRGYVNVDFPQSQHAVMTGVRPDVEADLTTLRHEPGTVSEVRLHHVFEHFRRGTALRLLIEWYGWLEEGGTLLVETPDFDRTAREFFEGGADVRRGVLLRHLYGSHEADWAVHCDGWYQEKFEQVLSALGYRDLEFTHSEWVGTFNVTVRARKLRPFLDAQAQLRAAESLLRESLLADVEGERKLLSIWLDELAARPAEAG
jgi:predicted SAM-dependent methyltransferase